MSPTTTHLLSVIWDCATELAFWLLLWGAASGVLFLLVLRPLLAVAARADRRASLGDQAEALAASHAARRADAIQKAAESGLYQGLSAPIQKED